jgi:hypothetical protein
VGHAVDFPHPATRLLPLRYRSSPANTGLLYDGISLDPLEVMFVKVKSFLLECRVPFAVQATRYQQWSQLVRSPLPGTRWGRSTLLRTFGHAQRPTVMGCMMGIEGARTSACGDC